jgi:type II secretory pathway pseudopilin PulG
MNSGTLITIIVVVVVVLIVLGLVVFLGRDRARETKSRRATELREKAELDELSARDREAKAASAAAEAEQAEVDAERLRREASARQNDANEDRAHAQEQVRRADKVDPNGTIGRHDIRATGEPDVVQDDDGTDNAGPHRH